MFSVSLKSAAVVAPSRTFMRVGTAGGRYETPLTFQMAFPAVTTNSRVMLTSAGGACGIIL